LSDFITDPISDQAPTSPLVSKHFGLQLHYTTLMFLPALSSSPADSPLKFTSHPHHKKAKFKFLAPIPFSKLRYFLSNLFTVLAFFIVYNLVSLYVLFAEDPFLAFVPSLFILSNCEDIIYSPVSLFSILFLSFL